MRRKFIFFKIFDHREHPDAVEKLSQREVERYVGPVTAIDNIFQLSLQPEVKRIIEKDLPLQQALTDALPQRGRHGYLWIGTELPDVVKAVARLAYIKEMFLFQQMLENDPPFLNKELKNCPVQEYNVYLWRAYRFWTLSFYRDRVFYIGNAYNSEPEVDNALRVLRDELNQKPDKPFQKDPSEMLVHSGDDNYHTLQQDRRSPLNDFSNKRWLHALVNSIAGDSEETMYLPFSGSGTVAMQNVLAGNDAFAVDINPIQHALTRASAQLVRTDPQEFARLSNEMMGKIKMLINASGETQVDLFLYSAEGQFLAFWEEERKRLKGLSLNGPDEIALKHVAATRFLIETKAVTRDEGINDLFYNALVNTLSWAIRKKEPIRFPEVYKKNLHDIYFNMYLLQKSNSFLKSTAGSIKASATDMWRDESGPYKSIVAHLPSWPLRGMLEKDRKLVSILNCKGAFVKTAETSLITGRALDEELKGKMESDLGLKKGLFARLPKTVQDSLNRLELMGKKEEIIRLLCVWELYHKALQHLARQLQENGLMAIILENPEIKLERESVTLPGHSVLAQLLANDKKIALEPVERFSKSVYLQRKKPVVYKVLILKKTAT